MLLDEQGDQYRLKVRLQDEQERRQE
jgi:hypothetical protein